MPKIFPPEFRASAINRARAGEPIAQIAKDMGVSGTGIRRWIAAEEGESDSAPVSQRAESVELAQLRKKLAEMEKENDVLRRAAAYFARDSLESKS